MTKNIYDRISGIYDHYLYVGQILRVLYFYLREGRQVDWNELRFYMIEGCLMQEALSESYWDFIRNGLEEAGYINNNGITWAGVNYFLEDENMRLADKAIGRWERK